MVKATPFFLLTRFKAEEMRRHSISKVPKEFCWGFHAGGREEITGKDRKKKNKITTVLWDSPYN